MSRHLAIGLACVLGATLPVEAGHEVAYSKEYKEVESAFPYEAGNTEIQFLAGPFLAFHFGSADRDSFDTVVGNLRYGRMLYSPSGDGFFRGNTEILVQAFGGAVFDGPGSYLVGAAVLLRYNFIQPTASIVPYLQVGIGGIYSDAADDEDQRAIGSDVSFDLEGSIGLRFHMSERWALVLEGGYRHISNADTADRNLGINSIGGLVGFSYFY